MRMENSVTHVEWVTTDAATLSSFLTGLFGWEFQKFSGDYLLYGSDDGVTIGVLTFSGSTPGGTPNVYIEVDSIDRAFTRAQELGGEVAVPKREIAQAGCYGFVRAPDGNLVGLHEKSRENRPMPD